MRKTLTTAYHLLIRKSTDDTETDMARRYALAAIQMVDLSHAEAQRTRRTLVALALAIRTEARAKRLALCALCGSA